MPQSGEQNTIATASDRLSSTAADVSASRIGVTPSFVMFTATIPFGFPDGPASRVDVSISSSLDTVRMTYPFGVIGAAASYVAIYTRPSFATFVLMTKPRAKPEDDHSLDSDVSKSLGLLYCQLHCIPSCKTPNNDVAYESTAVDSKESALVSQGGERNIMATASRRLSSRATSVSASRMDINPSFAMFRVTSPFEFTDGAASRVDSSTSPSLAMVRMTNPFGVIGAATSYVAMYTSSSFAMLAMVTKPQAEPEDDHSLDSDVSKSLILLYSQLRCIPSCKTPNNKVADESTAVDSTESSLESQSCEHNITATFRKRLSPTATSVSASRVDINPTFCHV